MEELGQNHQVESGRSKNPANNAAVAVVAGSRFHFVVVVLLVRLGYLSGLCHFDFLDFDTGQHVMCVCVYAKKKRI